MRLLKEQLEKYNEVEAERKRVFSEYYRMKKAYEEKMMQLESLAREVVNHASIYKYQEVIPVICYLVSLVEGKKYTFGEREIPVSKGYGYDSGLVYVDLSSYGYSDFKHKYKIQYICCDREAAENELDRKIDDIHAARKYSYDREVIPLIKKMVTTPALNYVQIAVFTEDGPTYYERGSVSFDTNDDYFSMESFLLIDKDSKICDPEFRYIVDFMNYLTVKKMETENVSLTQEEMMGYAREFAEEVKKEKSGEIKTLKKEFIEASIYFA